MGSIKISSYLATAIAHDDLNDKDGIIIVEEGDWIQDGKYQYKTTVFQKDDKFYSLTVSRSGSPFTDWYYEWEDTDEFECYEVEKVEITKYVWKVIN